MADPYLSGYTRRYKIVIPFAEVTGDETDFPFLVHLEGSADGGLENFDFSESAADGFDVRFTLADGETLLNFERERHDNVGERLDYHVSIDNVDASESSYFYLYQKDDDGIGDGADPPGTWDANFTAVYHMKNDPDNENIVDSIGNSNGVKESAGHPAEATGKIDKGQHFDGAQDYIDCGDSATHGWGNGDGTVSFWISIDENVDGEYILCRGRTHAGGKRYALWTGYHQSKLYVAGGVDDNAHTAVSIGIESETQLLSPGTFYRYSLVEDGGTLRLYKNGVETATGDTSDLGDIDDGTFPNLILGARHRADNSQIDAFFDGYLDEVRVSDIARSVTWLALSYRSGSDDILTFEAQSRLVGFAHSQGIMI